MQGFVGVKYTPLLVSTQVVAGIIYVYLCEASLPGSDSKWLAVVNISAPPDGTPVVTNIRTVPKLGASTTTATLDAQQLCGGYSPYLPLTPQDQQVFTTAMAGLLGVTYTPLLVSVQIVAGANYRFACTASIPGSSTVSGVIVEIFQPLSGPAVLVNIYPIPPLAKANV